MDFVRSLFSSTSVKDKEDSPKEDSTHSNKNKEEETKVTTAPTTPDHNDNKTDETKESPSNSLTTKPPTPLFSLPSPSRTTTTATATQSTPVPRERTDTGDSISSCRSSSDEEELLLIRDDGNEEQERYSQYEYAPYGRSSGSESGSLEISSENMSNVTTKKTTSPVTTAGTTTTTTTNKQTITSFSTVASSVSKAALTSSSEPPREISQEDSGKLGDGGYGGDDEGEQKISSNKYQRNKVSLKNFALIRVLGKGAFAKVLEVEKDKSGTRYAMKVLKKHHVQRKNQVEHTRTERRVLAIIAHPFICQLRYAFQTNKKLYLILDFHPGGELFYHLSRRGRFREHQARVYAAEITLALEYLHANDIVYRDLKPENILIQSDGHIALTDFGLAKDGVTSFVEGAKSFCGTPEYLAPEIIHRKGHGKAVDWWSLGMLIYELLTGLPPWYTKNRLHLFEDICWAPLRFPRHVSDSARSLIRGMLCRDPALRFRAKQCKEHAFYNSIDWSAALERGLTPAIVPIPGTAYVSREVRKLEMESAGQDPDALDGDSDSAEGFEGFSFEGGMSANRDSSSQSVDYDDEQHISNTEAAIVASSGKNRKSRQASVSEGEGTDAQQSTSLSVDSNVEASAVF
jgi:serine/threonine protein kinase